MEKCGPVPRSPGQPPAAGPVGRGGDEAIVTPGEVQRMFDAYALPTAPNGGD